MTNDVAVKWLTYVKLWASNDFFSTESHLAATTDGVFQTMGDNALSSLLTLYITVWARFHVRVPATSGIRTLWQNLKSGFSVWVGAWGCIAWTGLFAETIRQPYQLNHLGDIAPYLWYLEAVSHEIWPVTFEENKAKKKKMKKKKRLGPEYVVGWGKSLAVW